MSVVDRARTLVIQTELDLRRLIEEAVAQAAYAEVAQIAEMASLLRQAVPKPEIEKAVNGRVNRPAIGPTATSSSDNEPSPRQLREESNGLPIFGDAFYPRFARDEGRLIKIGWSQLNDREYEHKAPQEAARAVFEKLKEVAHNNHLFTMEDVLPVEDADANQVPSYQAYMVLAWMRDEGLVRRRGKDGYTIDGRATSPHIFEQLWASLPARS